MSKKTQAEIAAGSIHLERVQFNAWDGDQDSDEFSFAGYLVCDLVAEGVLPGGGDAVIGTRSVRVTVFHNEDGDNVAISFPNKKFMKGDEERKSSFVRMDAATYAWFKKTVPELPEVKRHLLKLYR